ncbi:hypothetical protein O3P69_014781 [Scylla paramamosain]|uniref:Uncharacterized protein n=1 Tax=Scylla paramamosain TaxID=85552 RepID=A0AAW0U106_SCYPA
MHRHRIEIEEEKTREEVTCSEEATAAAAIEESIDNYYPFSQDRNETFYRVPALIISSCAPEITNVPIFSGDSSNDIVSEATEASNAYVIGKVLEETLRVARNASDYDKASSNSAVNNSPIKSLLLSNEMVHMITTIETSVAFASKSEGLNAADKEKYRRVMDDLFALVATRNRSPELGHLSR